MSDEANRKFLMDKNSYVLDWLISEVPDTMENPTKEGPEQRIESLLSMLTRDTMDANVLRFKPGKK